MSEKIARYYVPNNNEHEAYHIGVPLGDVDQETWDALPAWTQASVDADPAYRKTRPGTAAVLKHDEPAPRQADKE